MRTRVHAPVLCVQFQTAANAADAADAEVAGGWQDRADEVR
jgi:hypothetical protein